MHVLSRSHVIILQMTFFDLIYVYKFTQMLSVNFRASHHRRSLLDIDLLVVRGRAMAVYNSSKQD